KLRHQPLQNRLGRLAMRALQVTELNNGDYRRLRTLSRTIRGLELGPRRSKWILSKRNQVADDGVLPIRRQIDVGSCLLVHRNQHLRDSRYQRRPDVKDLPGDGRIVTKGA